MTNWDLMSAEERSAFIRDSVENHHKAQYQQALASRLGANAPSWEELTDQQRENIREENRRFAREMQEFGNSLRKT
jgi:predicted Fe-S protein YdhL (DUF1289 family)